MLAVPTRNGRAAVWRAAATARALTKMAAWRCPFVQVVALKAARCAVDASRYSDWETRSAARDHFYNDMS